MLTLIYNGSLNAYSSAEFVNTISNKLNLELSEQEKKPEIQITGMTVWSIKRDLTKEEKILLTEHINHLKNIYLIRDGSYTYIK